MRWLLGILLLAILAATADAACTVQTIILPDGRVMVCHVCCDTRGNCYTVCG